MRDSQSTLIDGPLQRVSCSLLVLLLLMRRWQCYLYKPEAAPTAYANGEGTLNDGSTIRTHRSTHACFPAIPFALPTASNWSALTGTDPAAYVDYTLDQFEGWCAGTVGPVVMAQRATNRVLDLVDVTHATPFGRALRRVVEAPFGAYVSIENLILAFALPAGEAKLIAVTCAVSRISAILWVAVITLTLLALYLACCWPCFNVISLALHYCCCCGLLRSARRTAKRRAELSEDDDEYEDTIDDGYGDEYTAGVGRPYGGQERLRHTRPLRPGSFSRQVIVAEVSD